VILHGDTIDDAYELALEFSRTEGWILVHPFEDPLVIAGQGTIAVEILEDPLGKGVEAVLNDGRSDARFLKSPNDSPRSDANSSSDIFSTTASGRASAASCFWRSCSASFQAARAVAGARAVGHDARPAFAFVLYVVEA
jgi:hypothetical protein